MKNSGREKFIRAYFQCLCQNQDSRKLGVDFARFNAGHLRQFDFGNIGKLLHRQTSGVSDLTHVFSK